MRPGWHWPAISVCVGFWVHVLLLTIYTEHEFVKTKLNRASVRVTPKASSQVLRPSFGEVWKAEVGEFPQRSRWTYTFSAQRREAPVLWDRRQDGGQDTNGPRAEGWTH